MTTLLTDLQSSVLTIRLNRPERANALNFEMLVGLREAFEQAARDSQVRCVVLVGSGKSFCAGHDIGEMLAAQSQDVSYRQHLQETYNPLVLKIRQLEAPVLAAVNGPVAGAGLGLALACDLRFASRSAYFTVGFSGIGLVPDSGVSLLLPVLIGLGRATEFTFTNQAITAKQALEWGMVNRVLADDRLIPETGQLAAALAHGPTGTYGLTKRLFNANVLPHLSQVLDREGEYQELASRSEAHTTGVRRFLEKP